MTDIRYLSHYLAPLERVSSSAVRVWTALEADPTLGEAIAEGERQIASGRSHRLTDIRNEDLTFPVDEELPDDAQEPDTDPEPPEVATDEVPE